MQNEMNLEKMKELERDATPGNWYVEVPSKHPRIRVNGNGVFICETAYGWRQRADCEFAAHCRRWVPHAIATIEFLEKYAAAGNRLCAELDAIKSLRINCGDEIDAARKHYRDCIAALSATSSSGEQA